MRNLIERLNRAAVAEATYVPQSYEKRQAVEADRHEEVAKAARDVLKAAMTLHQAVAKGAGSGTQTFLETREQLWKVDIVEMMKQIATDHTRWAKNIRDASKEA